MARRLEVGVKGTRLWTISVSTVALAIAVGCSGPGSPALPAPEATPGAPTETDPVAISDAGAYTSNGRSTTPPGATRPEGALENALNNAGQTAAIALGMVQIGDGLGYTLVPSALPDGFELVQAELADIPGSPMATVFYQKGGARLSLFYPAFFVPEFGPTRREGLFLPPGDAVIRVVVAGELAYLMRGEWDEDTIQLLASYTAQWEYNGRLTLYFEYRREPGRSEWAMLSANTQTVNWIGVGQLIGIAESMDPLP